MRWRAWTAPPSPLREGVLVSWGNIGGGSLGDRTFCGMQRSGAIFRRAAPRKITPEGLTSAAPSLPAQAWTDGRATASRSGTSRELHVVSERGGHRTPRRAAPSKFSPLGGQRSTRSGKRGGHTLHRHAVAAFLHTAAHFLHHRQEVPELLGLHLEPVVGLGNLLFHDLGHA